MIADLHAARRSLPGFVAALVTAAGCSAASTSPAGQAPDGTITVTVTPSSIGLQTGATQTFLASVSGTTDQAVTWEIQEASGCGSVTPSGAYTAPGAAATCHVVARSHFDTSVTGRATVTVTTNAPISVSVTPTAPSTDACGTVTFHATVSGSSNQGVTWSVQEGASGGAITSGGVYTAPATASTYHVVAASQVDPTRTSAVPVVVGAERVLSVTVAPGSTSLAPSAGAPFTALITTTCGTSSATATVSPPAGATF